MTNTGSTDKIRVLFSNLSYKESNDIILPHVYGTLRSYIHEFYSQIEKNIDWEFPIYLWSHLNKIDFKNIDVFAVSAYVWNFETQMELARAYKNANPNGIVICGGPQIPKNGGEFTKNNPQIDFWVYKEGDEAFSRILESLVLYGNEHTKNNRFQFEEAHTCKSLPLFSPYLNNLYNPMIERHADAYLTALWETTRGCPYDCSFCNWGSYTSSKIRALDPSRIYAEIEWFGKNKISRVYITDANFGILNRDVEIAERLAEVKNKYGWPKEVWANYNKNTNDRVIKINDILLKSGLSYSGATISVQSLNATTLNYINRENIGFEKYLNLSDHNEKQNITSYTELIIGLPGETADSFKAGINVLVSKKVRNIRMYPALVLKNTDFDSEEYIDKHKIKSNAKKIYLEQHSIGDKEIIERAPVIYETNCINSQDIVEIYKFAYLTQSLYCTGFIKIIFDELLSSKMSFSSFINKFLSTNIVEIIELNELLNSLIANQLQTDNTTMFGAQYRIFNFQSTSQRLRAAPWNHIWIFLILNQKNIFLAIKKFITNELLIENEYIEDIFSYQEFLLMDLNLWKNGFKQVTFSTNFPSLIGFDNGVTGLFFNEPSARQGTDLLDYLIFSTGSTVITEFKYLINKKNIKPIC